MDEFKTKGDGQLLAKLLMLGFRAKSILEHLQAFDSLPLAVKKQAVELISEWDATEIKLGKPPREKPMPCELQLTQEEMFELPQEDAQQEQPLIKLPQKEEPLTKAGEPRSNEIRVHPYAPKPRDLAEPQPSELAMPKPHALSRELNNRGKPTRGTMKDVRNLLYRVELMLLYLNRYGAFGLTNIAKNLGVTMGQATGAMCRAPVEKQGSLFYAKAVSQFWTAADELEFGAPKMLDNLNKEAI